MGVEKDKIDEVLRKLPDELQDEVLKFAQSLLLNDPKSNAVEPNKTSVRQFFGVWESGDANSGDNERIDSDLGRHLSDSHTAD